MSKENKPIPPKSTFLRKRDEIEKQIEKYEKSIEDLAIQEYVASINGKYEDSVLAKERRYFLHSHVDALKWVITEDKKWKNKSTNWFPTYTKMWIWDMRNSFTNMGNTYATVGIPFLLLRILLWTYFTEC